MTPSTHANPSTSFRLRRSDTHTAGHQQGINEIDITVLSTAHGAASFTFVFRKSIPVQDKYGRGEKGQGKASRTLPISQQRASPHIASSKGDMDASGVEKPLAEVNGPAAHEVPANPPSTARSTLEEQITRWNRPRINVWRTLAACLGFIIMGMNDAAYGALIPYLESYYDLSYTKVSLVFLSPIVGYITSAFIINRVHVVLGRRGIAYIATPFRVVSYIIISQHPPFPALVVVFILAGYANGLEDGAWNAWVGNMRNANEMLGFLHGAYGLGAVLSPLIATSMVTKGNLPWYEFYYIMIGLSAVELIWAIAAFWGEDGERYRKCHPPSAEGEMGRTKEALTHRVTWICCVFLLLYVGIEVAVGGWIVVFMDQVRHVTPFNAGMTETGFWIGVTAGRVALGFVTPKIGEKLAILIYMSLAIAFHLVLYLVPVAGVSYVAVSVVGFFLGPLFPAAVVAATKILPAELHVSSIGFAAAFGSSGATIMPFVVGAIAEAKGVQVLMPIVLAALVADAAVWALLPGMRGEGQDSMGWRGWLGVKVPSQGTRVEQGASPTNGKNESSWESKTSKAR